MSNYRGPLSFPLLKRQQSGLVLPLRDINRVRLARDVDASHLTLCPLLGFAHVSPDVGRHIAHDTASSLV